MKPHLKAAHKLWQELLLPSDSVIDATCGNGHDTATLARLVPDGKVYALDIQLPALEKTKEKLLQLNLMENVELFHLSHAEFPLEFADLNIKLIVYNLGYLPGGDKSLTTQSKTTLGSVQRALQLLKPGGMVSITLYPGHEEGEKEAEMITAFAKNLPSNLWEVCHYQWINKEKSPQLLSIFGRPTTVS